MAEPRKLRISELDFNQVRENFKQFLQVQDEFRDYNVEGSVISSLLDLLAYNTHYNAFYLNMIANEMFLDSAVNRSSIVSLSKMLGYTPKSRTGARANVNLIITPTDSPSNVTVAKNTKFNSVIDGVNYVFVTDQSYSTTANNDNTTLTISNVSLVEGEPLVFRYTANTQDDTQRFVIPNRGVDHSSITVTLQEFAEDTRQYPYTLATDLLEVNSTSNIYFVEETSDFRTEIKFGDGVLGRAIETDNVVIINYNICSGILGNGANVFSVASTAGGYSSVTVSTNEIAVGGSDEETINSIRFNAPRHLDTQNRAVTKDDYKRIILRDYPQAESVIVYGGEDADPPQYGKVFVGIKPRQGLFLTSAVKNQISNNILKKYNVASVTPEFVDVDYTYVLLTSTVNYDARLTQKTQSTLRRAILNSINTYTSTKLNEFDQQLRFSMLTRMIDDSDTSIEGNNSYIRLRKVIEPTLNTELDYTLQFNNAINHPYTGYQGALISSYFEITDDQNIARTGCRIEDNDGILRIFRLQDGEKTIVRPNIGTINYGTGKVVLNSFNPISYEGTNISFTIIPVSNDVKTAREQIIVINESDVNLLMNDTSAIVSEASSVSASNNISSVIY